VQIGHFRVPKTLTFKMRLGAQPFLCKWVLFAWEWKMISISKAEHLPSFWNRGLCGYWTNKKEKRELGNGLFSLQRKASQMVVSIVINILWKFKANLPVVAFDMEIITYSVLVMKDCDKLIYEFRRELIITFVKKTNLAIKLLDVHFKVFAPAGISPRRRNPEEAL